MRPLLDKTCNAKQKRCSGRRRGGCRGKGKGAGWWWREGVIEQGSEPRFNVSLTHLFRSYGYGTSVSVSLRTAKQEIEPANLGLIVLRFIQYIQGERLISYTW